MRGDHSTISLTLLIMSGSPPLARGPRRLRCRPHKGAGITPACAGTTFYRSWHSSTFRDHPRLRGDHTGMEYIAWLCKGSPPLARGPHSKAFVAPVGLGITPACAGTTRPSRRCGSTGRDHPRLRGDHSFPLRRGKACTGSPPLARGPPCLGICDDFAVGITPACAGTTFRPPSALAG